MPDDRPLFLIVDDDFTTRALVRDILSSYGDCDMCSNGAEAVEAFRLSRESGAPYTCIFMDVMMPGKGGVEAVAEIRDMEKELGISPRDEIKVVMLSTLSDPKNVVKAYYEGGACFYLTKPVSATKIIKALREMGLDAVSRLA